MLVSDDLILKCINKDRRAEYMLYKIVYSYLMSICIRYTRDEDKAKEALNIGFYKILIGLPKYKKDFPFKVWIRKILINTLINEFKKDQKNAYNLEYVDNYEVNKYEVIDIIDDRVDKLLFHINQLPPVSQKVFNLYIIDGFSHKEIADLLNIAIGTSKWHLNFAKNKLKEVMLNTINNSKVSNYE